MDVRNVEVISFDCYGTLIDWESGILKAVRFAMPGLERDDTEILTAYSQIEPVLQCGLYLPYRKVLGETSRHLAERFGHELSSTAALADSLPTWEPFPETVAVLKRLQERYQLAVISNIDNDLFAATASRLEVSFDFVITAEDVGSYKPSLSNFRVALSRFGISSRQVLHVAESLFHDIAPAQKLGIADIWVNRHPGRAGASAGSTVKPSRTIRHLNDLIDYLL